MPEVVRKLTVQILWEIGLLGENSNILIKVRSREKSDHLFPVMRGVGLRPFLSWPTCFAFSGLREVVSAKRLISFVEKSALSRLGSAMLYCQNVMITA